MLPGKTKGYPACLSIPSSAKMRFTTKNRDRALLAARTLPGGGVRGGTPRHARTQAHAHAYKATHTHTHIGRPPQVMHKAKFGLAPWRTPPHKHACTHACTLWLWFSSVQWSLLRRWL